MPPVKLKQQVSS